MSLLLPLLLGVVAGLRTFTAPAAAAWAVHLGRVDLTTSRLAILGHSWLRWPLTGMALFELVFDQLPSSASRTVPAQFAGRIVTGAVSGAALGAADGRGFAGALAGVIGAVAGTLAGSRARLRLASALRNDHPAAVLEDVVAIGAAVMIVSAAGG